MIKTKYKSDLTESSILPHKNILSWSSDTNRDNLPIIEISPRVFFMLWWKSLWTKVYLLVSTDINHKRWSYEFFRIPSKK